MNTHITSAQNPRVKLAAKLRDSRGRRQQGRIIIDGVREIARALYARAALDELFYCEALCDSQAMQTARQAAAAGATLLSVTPDIFGKLSFGDRKEGIVATAARPQLELAELQLGPTPLVAVLEGVEKPGNLGAAARTADAAGLDALVLVDSRVDPYNPGAIRASLGAVFTVQVCQADARQTLDWLHEQKLAVVAAVVDGAIDYRQAPLQDGAAIVLGSEAHGLTDIWRTGEATLVRLPMRGVVDSLNISAAAAVLFYEAVRQRETPQGVARKIQARRASE